MSTSISPAYGEVIAADSQSLTVECHALYGAPGFGQFVRADCAGSGRRHFAVVTHITSGPFDGNRVVQAHGLPPGELEQRKPHLPDLLRTLFTARLVGYGDEAAIVAATAPLPPRLHCFVSPASPEEVRRLTEMPDFLRPLTAVTDAPLEDLLVSAARAAAGVRPEGERHAALVRWGKFLARLLRKDYLTLENVLSRLQPAGLTFPAPAPTSRAGRAAPLYEEPLPLYGAGRPAADGEAYTDLNDPFGEA